MGGWVAHHAVLEAMQTEKPQEKDPKVVLSLWDEQSPEPEAGWEVTI